MKRSPTILILCTCLLLAACGGNASAAKVDITPSQCQLTVGDQVTMSLSGVIASDATIQWSTSGGIILAQNQGLNAVFTAPQEPGEVLISIYITSNLTPASPVTRTCVILPSAQGGGAAPPTKETKDPVVDNSPLAGTALVPNALSVVISEVMANPCGNEDFKKWNEYVELYNASDQPVDVGGWWLADNGPDNRADMLVSWAQRQPNVPLNGVVTGSTVIPAHGFAVVLSPIYAQGMAPHYMPYHFPDGTVILTVVEGDRLGDDTFGIIGDGNGRDVLVLYTGGQRSIQQVVSTYGTPQLGLYPQDIHDDRADLVPLDLHECSSAERVSASSADSAESWREVLQGSPGEAPYQ